MIGRPHAVHQKCEGKGCKDCGQAGWLPTWKWHELKTEGELRRSRCGDTTRPAATRLYAEVTKEFASKINSEPADTRPAIIVSPDAAPAERQGVAV